MKYLQCTSPGHLTYGESPDQTLAKGHALIRIKKVGVCGTDIHAFEGTQPYFTYPRILGHELAGVIESTEGNSRFKSGDTVTVVPYFHCGDCHMCRSGRTNACISLNVCGVHVDGGLREYFSVSTEHLIHADGLTNDQLALVEPLSVGCHAVRRAGISSSDVVVVVGAGPIGYGVMLFAGITGATVIALDVDEWRLSRCAHLPGVTTVMSGPADAVEKIKQLTNGRMATVVMDATGNLGAMQTAFPLMSHGGIFVLVGLQKENISFSHPEFHKREATLMSSRNATKADFQFVMESIRSGRIDPLPMITHRIPFARAADDFPGLLKRGNGLLKALIEF